MEEEQRRRQCAVFVVRLWGGSAHLGGSKAGYHCSCLVGRHFSYFSYFTYFICVFVKLFNLADGGGGGRLDRGHETAIPLCREHFARHVSNEDLL